MKEKINTEQKKEKFQEKPSEVTLIRIASADIPGGASIYSGLTKIKGISFMLSAAICKILNFDKRRKFSTLTDQEISQIELFIKNVKLPYWILNRRADPETGINKHLVTADLDLQKEFDIRKIKKIKSYKGVRHILGQPVRGQRTRGHFRKKGRAVGVKRVKTAATAAPPAKK